MRCPTAGRTQLICFPWPSWQSNCRKQTVFQLPQGLLSSRCFFSLRTFCFALEDRFGRYDSLAIIAESQTPEVLTRRLIDGTLDLAILLEPAQLDIMHIQEIATLEIICVSSSKDMHIDEALRSNYVFVDWGLSFGLDHRRAFPDAPESKTRVSQAKIAYEYISAVGGSAYLPRRMVEKDLEFNLLQSGEILRGVRF